MGEHSSSGWAELLVKTVTESRDERKWGNLPPSFLADRVKYLKGILRPHLNGLGNHLIKARCKLAKARDHDGLVEAVTAAIGGAK